MILLIFSGAYASTVPAVAPNPPTPGAVFTLEPRVPIVLNLVPNT